MTDQIKTEIETTIDDFSTEQKAAVMELIILTVKEIREQIAQDIEATIPLWKRMGYLKSRRTAKAFKISAAIARGLNETLDKQTQE
jgi:hypothetical protein